MRDSRLPSGMRKRGKVYYAWFQNDGVRVRKRLSTDFRLAKKLLHELQLKSDYETAAEHWWRIEDQAVRELGSPGVHDGKAGIVYFIEAQGLACVKIGWSGSLCERIASLRTCVPFELRLLGIMAGTTGTEGRIHAAFREFHIRNEWFAMVRAVREFIDEQCVKVGQDWVSAVTKMEHEIAGTTMAVDTEVPP